MPPEGTAAPGSIRFEARWGGPPTPLVRAPPVWAVVPLAGLLACGVGLPLAFALGVNPLFTLVPLLLLGFALVSRGVEASVRRSGLEVVVEPGRIEVRSRHAAMAFPIGETRARLEVREWTSPRTTGHNLWTVIVLEHAGQACVLGTWGAFGPRAPTRGLPTVVLDEAPFRRVAAAFALAVEPNAGPDGR